MTQPTRHRKKPIVITALQWTGDNLDEMREFTDGKFGFMAVDIETGTAVYDELHDTWVGVNLHDWIIRGVKGEFYPCQVDVFTTTYEPADMFKPAIPDEAIEILIDYWHNADLGSAIAKLQLHELLGMTWDQYKTWVVSDSLGSVAMPAQTATWLVAGALSDLWMADQDEGCCPTCCAPCGALKQLLDAGTLDDIARPYSATSSMWDEAANQVDRGFLTRAWRMIECHDGEMSPERAEEIRRLIAERDAKWAAEDAADEDGDDD